jgi:hypothetical protein
VETLLKVYQHLATFSLPTTGLSGTLKNALGSEEKEKPCR